MAGPSSIPADPTFTQAGYEGSLVTPIATRNRNFSAFVRYFFSSSQQTVVNNAQNGTSSGFYWFQNPVASAYRLVMRRIALTFSMTAATTSITAPTISFSKMTFTGTASGASEANLPEDTAAPASTGIWQTAVTGMTPTIVAPFVNAHIAGILTPVGEVFGYEEILPFDPFGVGLKLDPGEGIAVWQSTGGTSSDVRKFSFNVAWDEVQK